MSANPSRTVRRATCIVCKAKFKPTRRDATYCSGACRQRASRARAESSDIDRKIEEARLNYWKLVGQKAHATRNRPSQILTEQAQLVDEDGNVWMGGEGMGGMGEGRRLVGRVKPRPGWSSWGLEAAGAPFSAPPVSPLKPNAKRKEARTAS